MSSSPSKLASKLVRCPTFDDACGSMQWLYIYTSVYFMCELCVYLCILFQIIYVQLCAQNHWCSYYLQFVSIHSWYRQTIWLCMVRLVLSFTLQETNISPKNGIFEDDFPFPKVGYVNPLKGILLNIPMVHQKHHPIETHISSSLDFSGAHREAFHHTDHTLWN